MRERSRNNDVTKPTDAPGKGRPEAGVTQPGTGDAPEKAPDTGAARTDGEESHPDTPDTKVSGRKSRKRRNQKKHTLPFVIFGLLFLLAAAALFVYFTEREKPIPVNTEQAIKRNKSLLTPTEQEAWREQDAEPGKAYLQFNTDVTVEDGKADIRFINPAYSGYYYQFTILNKSDTIYVSDFIPPGSVIKSVGLKEIPAAGTHSMQLLCRFYNKSHELLGSSKESFDAEVKQ